MLEIKEFYIKKYMIFIYFNLIYTVMGHKLENIKDIKINVCYIILKKLKKCILGE